MGGALAEVLTKPFTDSIHNVLSTMAQAEVKCGLPILRAAALVPEAQVKNYRVAGVIGLAGEKYKGSMVLIFPATTITKIASAMLFQEYSEVNNDVLDCLCEIANMVSGGARNVLSQIGYDFDMALPICLQGENTVIYHNHHQEPTIVPLETTHGPMQLELLIMDRS